MNKAKKNDGWTLKGISTHIQSLCDEIERVATKDISVLIMGQSGTGKELIAKELHNRSLRKNKKLVNIDCGSFSLELFENEMFGHTSGAFTGSLKNGKVGFVEEANGGTLFLDEIGNLRPEHQGKLLRFLEERKYCKVGTTKETLTDIRLISATNKNLLQESYQGRFRQDLLERLNHRIIKTIPLKDRRIDIIFLLHEFINYAEFKKLKIDPRVKYLLNFYDFPGNVRQLKTLLHNADDYQYIRNILVEELANRYGKNSDTIFFNNFYAETKNDHEKISDPDEISQKNNQLEMVTIFLAELKHVETTKQNWESITKKYEILKLWADTKLSKEDICQVLHINKNSLYPGEIKKTTGFDELPPRGEVARMIKRWGDIPRYWPL